MAFSRYREPPRGNDPQTKRTLVALAVLVVVLAGALVWQRAGPFKLTIATGSGNVQGGRIGVTSVHDGDTFRIGAERIRVLGMDAPEIGRGANCDREQRAAIEARDFLARAVRGNNVRIERNGLDVYGRTLARVYVDGRDIASVMLASGLARPYVRGRHGDWC